MNNLPEIHLILSLLFGREADHSKGLAKLFFSLVAIAYVTLAIIGFVRRLL